LNLQGKGIKILIWQHIDEVNFIYYTSPFQYVPR
jgi:hypothetical protein